MRADLPIPVYVKETTSTNNFMRGYLLEHPDAPCWQSVYTDYQTAGRGQRGNSWSSEPGKNMTMSFYFKLKQERLAFRPFDICVFVSLGLRQVVTEHLPDHEVSIKWPNDIYVGNKKVAGILIENEWEGKDFKHSIVGVGVNVNQAAFGDDAPNATSILIEKGTHEEVMIVKFMKRCLHEFVKIWRQMRDDFVSARDEYNMLLYWNDDQYHPFMTANGPIEAKIIGVDVDGMLSVRERKTDKILTFAFKEIAYLNDTIE